MGWLSLGDIKGIPMKVIWSSEWSEDWCKEGQVIAEELPEAKLTTHSGGQWPQEDVANELAENMVTFVTSLRASVRSVEEPIPEHIQKLLHEANEDPHHYHHCGNEHHGDHAHPGMDAYKLSHGWPS